MSAQSNFLAVFLGSPTSPRMQAWQLLSDSERQAKEAQGMAAWNAWVDQHQSEIVELGGPLGKTKKASGAGVEDTSNVLAAFTIVRAPSHEAAVRLFEDHPHFTIFPGEGVEVMPVMPIPSA